MPERRDYYVTLTELARTGRSEAVPEGRPVAFRELKYVTTGAALKLLDIADPTPKASLYRDGKELLSINEYEKLRNETNAEIVSANEAGKEALALLAAENELIGGTAMQRGLRQTLDDQFVIRKALLDELDYIDGPTFNRIVERGLFTQRLESVRARQAELSR